MKTATWVLLPLAALSIASTSGLAALSPKSLPPSPSTAPLAVAQTDSEDEIEPTVQYADYKKWLLSWIASAYVEVGEFEKALDVAAIIVDDLHQALALEEIALALAGAGNLPQALDVVATIADNGMKIQVLRSISRDLADAGNLPQALEVIEIIPENWARASTLQEIAVSSINAGDSQSALPILERARTVAKTIPDYGEKAHRLWLISIDFAEAGDIQQALNTAATIADEEANAKALQGIAYILAKTGNLPQALEIAETTTDDWAKAQTLKSISRALTGAGDLSQALEVAETIADDRVKATSLKTIAFAFIEAGDRDRAAQILTQAAILAEERMMQDLLFALEFVRAFVQMGDLQQALAVADLVTDEISQAIVLGSIVSTSVEVGNLQQALEVARMMPEEEDLNEDLNGLNWTNAGTFAMISKAFVEAGDLQQALQVAETISDGGINDDTKAEALTAIALACAEIEDSQIALSILGQVAQAARNLESYDTYETMLMAIAIAWAKAGEFSKALEFARTITKDFWEAEVVGQIAAILMETRSLQEAVQLTEPFTDDWLKAEVLRSIAVTLVKTGDVPQALHLGELLNNREAKAWWLQKIAITIAESGDSQQALNVARTIPNTEGLWKAEALQHIAGFFHEAGRTERAIELLDIALELLRVKRSPHHLPTHTLGRHTVV